MFMFSKYFSENLNFYEIMFVKYCPARQVTDDNIIRVHALCKRDNEGYRRSLKICSTYRFSTAKMVTRMRLNVMSYIACLFNSVLHHTEPLYISLSLT